MARRDSVVTCTSFRCTRSLIWTTTLSQSTHHGVRSLTLVTSLETVVPVNGGTCAMTISRILYPWTTKRERRCTRTMIPLSGKNALVNSRRHKGALIDMNPVNSRPVSPANGGTRATVKVHSRLERNVRNPVVCALRRRRQLLHLHLLCMELLIAFGDELYDRGEDPALGELVDQIIGRKSPTRCEPLSLAFTSGAAPLDASISRSTTATRMPATRTTASPHSSGALFVGTRWRPCAGPGLGPNHAPSRSRAGWRTRLSVSWRCRSRNTWAWVRMRGSSRCRSRCATHWGTLNIPGELARLSVCWRVSVSRCGCREWACAGGVGVMVSSSVVYHMHGYDACSLVVLGTTKICG